MHSKLTFFDVWFPKVSHGEIFQVASVFVCGLLLLGVLIVYPKLRHPSKNVLPPKTFSPRAIVEIILGALWNLAHDVIGPQAPQYFPFVGTIFLFLFVSNLLGLIPGFYGPTQSWVAGAAIATLVFISYHVYGFQANGLKYLTHFVAPLSLKGVKNIFRWILLAIPLLVFQILFGGIEIMSNILRPIVLSLRLFFNVFADHRILEVFSGFAPYLLPILFLGLELFVSFMQAFIFTILSMVYISLAIAHEH